MRECFPTHLADRASKGHQSLMTLPFTESYMDHALAEAQAAAERGEVPVGAVLVDPAGQVLAAAGKPDARTPRPDRARRNSGH